jgi:hypothetical protein
MTHTTSFAESRVTVLNVRSKEFSFKGAPVMFSRLRGDVLTLVSGVLILMMTCSDARAAFSISISGDVTQTITDNGSGDGNPNPGKITVNSSLAFGDDFISFSGSASSFNVQSTDYRLTIPTFSVSNTSSSTAIVQVTFTETNVLPSLGIANGYLTGSSRVSSSSTSGSTGSFVDFVSISGGPTVNLHNSPSFAYPTSNIDASGSSYFSGATPLTIQLTLQLTLPALTAITYSSPFGLEFNAPVPAGLALVASALPLLAFAGWTRRKRTAACPAC